MAFVDAALAVGAAVGLEGTAATVAGGALMGAGAGGLYGALSGGSILKDALIGGGIGGLGAGALGAMGAGAAAAPEVATGALAPTGGAAVTGGLAPVAQGSVGAITGDPIAGMNALNGWTGTGASTLPDVSAADMAGINNPAVDPTSGGIPSWAKWGAGALGLGALMNANNKKYGTFTQNQVTTNPLPYPSNFNTYKALDTSVMRPMGAPASPYAGTVQGTPGYIGSPVGYAAGGIADANPIENPSVGPVEQMSRDNAVGQNQMFPQAAINSPAFSSATNTPMGSNMIAPAGDTNVDPYSGAERFAAGGHLGGYSDGGRMLKGPGDGISDSIPALIGGKQPARLADGEFVLPSRIVSEIGNGSTEAGARKLYAMMDRVQNARKKSIGKGKFAKDGKAAKELDKL